MSGTEVQLVIGGYGFLGSHVAAHLRARGERVRVLDLAAAPYPSRGTAAGVDVLQGSFLDPGVLPAALEGVASVYHFASTTVPATSAARPIFDVETNVVGLLRLLEACRQHGVDQVIFPSSGGTVYGVLEAVPAAETHPTRPISPYGITKLTCEKYLHYYHHRYGLRYKVLRIANPYGVGQDPTRGQGVINAFLWRLATGQPIHIWGDGSVVRDYLFVDDLARAVLAAGDHPSAAAVLNVGSMTGTSLRGITAAMFEVTGQTVPITYEAQRTFDVPRSILDTTRMQRTTGWAPRVGLREGIARTWDWVQRLTNDQTPKGGSP